MVSGTRAVHVHDDSNRRDYRGNAVRYSVNESSGRWFKIATDTYYDRELYASWSLLMQIEPSKLMRSASTSLRSLLHLDCSASPRSSFSLLSFSLLSPRPRCHFPLRECLPTRGIEIDRRLGYLISTEC